MCIRRIVYGLCIVCFMCFFPSSGQAMTIEEEIAILKERIAQLEERLARQEKKETETTKFFENLSVGGGMTFVMQGASGANGDAFLDGEEDTTDAAYSFDLEFEKKLGEGGVIVFHFETGDGAGIDDELKVFSPVNRDADDSDNSVSFTEGWIALPVLSKSVTLAFGKLDVTRYLDQNNFANDETTQFLGSTFRNSPVVEFPDDNAVGAHLLWTVANHLEISLVMADANADGDDFFDGVFSACQVDYQPQFLNQEGHYRVYFWHNNKKHIKWLDPAKTNESSYGIGLSFDQTLTPTVGIFGRYGWQNPNVFAEGQDFSLEQAWSVGLQWKLGLGKRENDIFAIALGQIFPSSEYKKANDVRGWSEKHLEAYYSIYINDVLAITPDIHVIWQPFGGDATNGDDTIFVGGIRTQVTF